MPNYEYISSNDKGQKTKGTLEAANETELQLRLKANNQYLLTCKTVKATMRKPLKSPVLADFSRQIGSLLGAGVSLVRALGILTEEEDLKPEIRDLYEEILKSVRRGTPLSEAMEEQDPAFPDLMIYMYRSAEASGKIEQTAMKMADHYDKDYKLAQKVKSSMTYPKILSILIVVVVVILMGFVLPQFEDMFSQMDSLPLPTIILFGISNFVKKFWWLLIILVVAAIPVFRILLRIPVIKKGKDQLLLKLPGIGKLLKVIYTARFARTLSSLYACGISIVSALQITRNVIGNLYIEEQFDGLVAYVRSGNTLSTGLSKLDGFVKKLSSSVRVGEESGSLENLLTSMADSFDYESEMSLNKLVSYLEPAMIVVMALIVGTIVAGVILPIYGSMSTIG